MIKDSIQFGSKTIDYTLSFSKRKSLGITVTPDMEVLVTAPENTDLEPIREKIRKRAPWILKQLSFFLSFYPKTPERKYISGESHYYLGRQYLLKVTQSENEVVKYKGRYIEVFTPKKEKAAKLLKGWYRSRAKIKFSEIAAPLIERFKKYAVAPSEISIQEMPTRWGSCTPKGKIILNPELIKAPKPCIEYVIIHELCHLLHPNHSPAFQALQTKEMPDWEKWKFVLDSMG